MVTDGGAQFEVDHADREPGGSGGQFLLESGLGFRLSRLVRAIRADWTRQLHDLGVTPPQAAVLRGVADSPGCSLRALARTLGAEPMRAKRCIDDLEARGLIESAHRGRDRRPRALELTADGLDLAHRISTLVQLHERRLDGALGSCRSGLVEALVALESDLGLPAGPGPEETRRARRSPRRR